MNKPTSLEQASKAVSRLWKKMCAEKGVPVDSKFVVFDPGNKYLAQYTKAVHTFFRLKNSLEVR